MKAGGAGMRLLFNCLNLPKTLLVLHDLSFLFLVIFHIIVHNEEA